MYPEFIAIYVGLGILFVMLIIIMVLLIVLLKKNGKNEMNSKVNSMIYSSRSIAFCKNCATQFDASQRCCPKCGTPR